MGKRKKKVKALTMKIQISLTAIPKRARNAILILIVAQVAFVLKLTAHRVEFAQSNSGSLKII